MAPATKPIIISASRRTDMVAGNPDHLLNRLQETAPPEQVHTVVIWTKNPANLIHHRALNSCLRQYEQLFLLYSITGLGGSMLEPGVPPPDQAIAWLPDLLDLFKGPERVRVRFDPIVHFTLPNGDHVCNLEYFATLAPALVEHHIKHVITSWVQLYPKVKSRLARNHITPHEPSAEQRKTEAAYLQSIAAQHNIQLHGCSMPDWPVSKCIDASLYNELHPQGIKASLQKAPGQRPLCGCNKAKDIGWYYSCPNGCLYCYGNPAIPNKNNNH